MKSALLRAVTVRLNVHRDITGERVAVLPPDRAAGFAEVPGNRLTGRICKMEIDELFDKAMVTTGVDRIRRAMLWALAAAAPVWAVESDGADRLAALLGRWRSRSTSKGGIGSMLEFRNQGVLEYSSGAVVEMTHRVEGETLVLPSATVGGPEIRESITWLGDDRIRFRSAAEGDPGQEFSRAGRRESAADPLRGEWIGSRDMGGRTLKVLRLFRGSGKGLLLIPFLSQTGRYSVIDGKLRLEIANKPAWDSTFAVAGDVLRLTSADAKETTYERY